MAAARARAAEIKNEAERSGRVEAEEFFREGITRVEKAAAAIGEAASRDAEQLMRIGEKQLDRAARRLYTKEYRTLASVSGALSVI